MALYLTNNIRIQRIKQLKKSHKLNLTYYTLVFFYLHETFTELGRCVVIFSIFTLVFRFTEGEYFSESTENLQ